MTVLSLVSHPLAKIRRPKSARTYVVRERVGFDVSNGMGD